MRQASGRTEQKIYIPTPKQAEFHRSDAKYRAFIGGFGSGKSVAGSLEAWKHIGLYPGSFGLIGRLEFSALQHSSMKTFFEWGPSGGWFYNTQEHKLYVPQANGRVTEVLFWHLDDPDPLRSMEFDWWWIDEAHEVPESTVLMLQSRLRGHVGPLRGWITSNPNGHDYLWKWFINKAKLPKEKRKDYFGIVATTKDNISNLPDGYVDDLLATYPPEWVDRFLNASFDVFEGQIYTELTQDDVYFIDPYPIPQGWEIRLGMDVGFTNPTAVIWTALDGDGRLIAYNEYYRAGAEPEEHMQALKIIDPAIKLRRVFTDPAADQKTSASRKSTLQQYRELGLRVIPANNAVWPGILAVKQRLRIAADGFPRLMIMKNCERLISELKSYRWESLPEAKKDEKNPPEMPLKKDDHGPDALRYVVMSYPVSEEAERRREEEAQPPRRRIRSKVAGY